MNKILVVEDDETVYSGIKKFSEQSLPIPTQRSFS